MNSITEKIITPEMGEYDIIITGGGVGGICAAVSAKRNGIDRILVIEKSIQFGGLATNGLISWYEPLCDGQGKKIMYGMADELMQLALRYGSDTLPEAWRNNPDGISGKKRFSSHFSPAMFVLALDQLLKENGIDLLLDTLAVLPVMDGNTCTGVVVENKTGRGFYRTKVLIDATGDADMLSRAGVPCVSVKNHLTCICYLTNTELAKKAVDKNDMIYLRKWLNAGSDLWGKGHPENLPMLTGTTAEEVTQYVLDGRRLLFDMIKDDDRRVRDITALPGMAQLRTTRRIAGDYTLTEDDEGKHFDDSIAVAGDFAKPGKRYEVPYRVLFNSGFNNIFTAGRSISSSGWAWDITRVIPVAAATGQAAGTAAAICVKQGKAVCDLHVPELQRQLTAAGVHIHF